MTEPDTNLAEDPYPAELKKAELAAITERRTLNGLPSNAPLVGFALSGGGIRSATFCLGLFQALASLRLVRRIDLLSTVSGGGYFGSFLGASFMRKDATPQTVEDELADNQSWPMRWLRDNGRCLSPNGAGDNCMAAAVALRNWVSLQVVLLTLGFLLLGLGQVIRAELFFHDLTSEWWACWENYLWTHQVLKIWWSPWLILPALSLVGIMLVTGSVYWLTQSVWLMKRIHLLVRIPVKSLRAMRTAEFIAQAQTKLSRCFMVGLVTTTILFSSVLIDSLGQTAYINWTATDFHFWAFITGAGAAAYGFGSKIIIFFEERLGKRKISIPFDLVALAFALVWLLLILCGLSALVSAITWRFRELCPEDALPEMSRYWLMSTVACAFVLSWWFSRNFGFVNLSSMQQLYAARLRRAYIGATNPKRRKNKNYSMTDLITGDDLSMVEYQPHQRGGPLHVINVTLNETISGKSHIEQRDRKGLNLAIGACGLSIGARSHALWGTDARKADQPAPKDEPKRTIKPIIAPDQNEINPLHAPANKRKGKQAESTQHVEALSLGRWVAISGAAFTTGLGAGTRLGLSLLLGLGNIRLGYWWDSGVPSRQPRQTTPISYLERGARFLSWLMPVQMCLLNEFCARFHGPSRRHWYLSDGGHFENTACYELIRRRVPLIICSDAGQDPRYQFGDLAKLVLKARIDFGAEIQIVHRAEESTKDDPSLPFPMPSLEEIINPELRDVIGSPEDFPPLAESDETDSPTRPAQATRHALLARIRYIDDNSFSWLLMIKPSLMGDESLDVVQYQRSHSLFPQEPTSDQYFDEAQWESYRKLGEHIGIELFTAPTAGTQGWSPSLLTPPVVT